MMTPKERAAMQQALEALLRSIPDELLMISGPEEADAFHKEAITALRSALADSAAFSSEALAEQSVAKFVPVGIVNDMHCITWIESVVDDQAPIGAILYALQDSVGRNVYFAKEQK